MRINQNTILNYINNPQLFENKEKEEIRNELARQGIQRENEKQYYIKEIERLNNIIKEEREKVDNFDVFKEFTFPLMKRDEEQQVKSSIDYEWRKSIKEPILEILDKENKDE